MKNPANTPNTYKIANDQWQPIETAPKDGTWVLVYGDGADDEAEQIIRNSCG